MREDDRVFRRGRILDRVLQERSRVPRKHIQHKSLTLLEFLEPTRRIRTDDLLITNSQSARISTVAT
jgi:hypothetical protein